MKTLLLVVMMLFASTASQAQMKGIPFNKAIPFEDVVNYSIDEMYGILIKLDSEDVTIGILAKLDREDVTIYTYFYEVKAKGYYDALKKLKYILDANDITRGPDEDDTYFQSHVDRDDYNGVVHELRIETGWIQEAWYVDDDEWKVFMVGNADAISVGVIHNKSLAAAEKSQLEKQEEVIPPKEGIKPIVEEQAPPPESEPLKVSERALYMGRKDTDNYASGLSGGGGIDFSLAGRNPVSLPKPEYNTQVSGTIVVRIRVNRDGKVISAEPGYKGTNILDENLLEAARKAALKARFNASADAAYTQVGTITYHFVLQ